MGHVIQYLEYVIHHPKLLHEFKEEARDVILETHELPNTPAWHLLAYREELHPKNFFHYHPEFRDIFELYHEIKTPIPTTPPPSSSPEPSSIILMALGIIIFYLWRKI